MVEAAVAGHPGLEASDLEMRLGGESSTAGHRGGPGRRGPEPGAVRDRRGRCRRRTAHLATMGGRRRAGHGRGRGTGRGGGAPPPTGPAGWSGSPSPASTCPPPTCAGGRRPASRSTTWCRAASRPWWPSGCSILGAHDQPPVEPGSPLVSMSLAPPTSTPPPPPPPRGNRTATRPARTVKVPARVEPERFSRPVRRLVFGGALLVLFALIPVLAWLGGRAALDEGGRRGTTGPTDASAPGYQALVNPTPTRARAGRGARRDPSVRSRCWPPAARAGGEGRSCSCRRGCWSSRAGVGPSRCRRCMPPGGRRRPPPASASCCARASIRP